MYYTLRRSMHKWYYWSINERITYGFVTKEEAYLWVEANVALDFQHYYEGFDPLTVWYRAGVKTL